MYRDLWKILKPFHKPFFILFILSFLGEMAQMISSSFISILVKLLDDKPNNEVWVFVFVGYFLFGELNMRLDNAFDWHVIFRLSHPIYKHLKLLAMEKFMNLGLLWHSQKNSSALVGQVSDGVWKTLEIVDSMSWEIIPSTVQFGISIITMTIISWQITLLCLLAITIFMIITAFGEKKKNPLRESRQDMYVKEGLRSHQSVQAIETVKAYVREAFELLIINSLQDDIIHTAKKEHTIGVYWMNRWRIRDLINIRGIIYLVCVGRVLNLEMDTPTLIFTSTLMERMFNSLWRFSHVADRLFRNYPAIRRYMGLATEKEPVETGTISRKLTQAPEIKFVNVCATYKDEYSVDDGALHDVSVTVPAGSMLAIVGTSGGGKTTFAKCLDKFIEVQQGDIIIDGTSIRDWTGKGLRQNIATVHQDFFVFDDTIRANIVYGNPQASQATIEEVAKLTGIHEFITTLPNGYDTVVGERGVRLSGGQKQRVVLARALLATIEIESSPSHIILFDEATSDLDVETEHRFQESLVKALVGKTSFVIAHRLSTIRLADKIIVLQKGRIVEMGTRDELLALKGIYAGMEALSKFD